MTYDLKICQCPVRIPSKFWAREREPTGVCLSKEGLGARQKQAADFIPQLAASPSDNEQGNT